MIITPSKQNSTKCACGALILLCFILLISTSRLLLRDTKISHPKLTRDLFAYVAGLYQNLWKTAIDQPHFVYMKKAPAC